MKFNCEVKPLRPSIVLVRLKGVLDAGTSVELEAAIADSLKDETVKKMILDISEMTFIASSGLRVMMQIIKAMVPRGGKLYLVGASSQVVGLVKMSGMTKWVTFKNSLLECDND